MRGPTSPSSVDLDRRERGVGLAAKNRHNIYCSRPLRDAWSTERVPLQHSSEYREGDECSCKQVDGAAEGRPPPRTGNKLAAVLPQILDSMPE